MQPTKVFLFAVAAYGLPPFGRHAGLQAELPCCLDRQAHDDIRSAVLARAVFDVDAAQFQTYETMWAMNLPVLVEGVASPALVTNADARASMRFLEIFASAIRNPHTRRA